MKYFTCFLFATVVALSSTSSFSQHVSGGINIVDLPFQIYGGNVRLEPSDNLYVEAFGSFRPLAERQGILFGSYEREGTVFDISLGAQTSSEAKGRRSTFSFGPFIQRKRFTGQEQCSSFAGFGCGRRFPEKIYVRNIGLRVGTSMTLKNGLYLQAYAGAGFSNKQSQNEIERAREEREISIQHEDVYAHARLIMGWQIDLRREK